MIWHKRGTPVTFLILIGALLLIQTANALSCSAQWMCIPSVSEDYNFVACTNGTCHCLEAQGFEGRATADDRCRCESPKSVYWEDGTPYCLSYEDSMQREVEERHTQQLIQRIREVYESTIYPTPLSILTGNNSIVDVFAPDAQGRADPFGTFHDREVLIEYFWGLAVTEVRVIAVHFKDIFGYRNHVYARVVFAFEDFPPLPHRFWNLTQTARYVFDEEDRIKSVEIVNHNVGKVTDAPEEAHAFIILGICARLLIDPGKCNATTDPEGYYTSMEDCVAFMSAIPHGSFNDLRTNSVSCRQFHSLLTYHAPFIHCPHAGKTGGGMCRDIPPEEYYLEDF